MGGVRRAVRRPARRWMPHLWASWKPLGIGEQRPNNYLEILRALWENRDQLGYAWRILRDGVCDGCALGTSGMHDWTITGIHLCNIRLRLLRLNTMPPLDIRMLSDVRPLAQRSSRELRSMGRLPYPMIRRRGEPGFRRISWEEALDCIAGFIRQTSPERLGFYLTSRGLPNEAYYVAQKAVRAMGTNSIDNAARVCHAPSTLALKAALGVAATTCSYTDLIGTDLIVFFGSNVANNQPVMMKYLYYARKAGTRVVLVNPYREPAMERYWVPSDLESALFGTRITDRFFQIRVGGDIAFINGAIKHMIQRGWVDEAFIRAHTTGFEELRAVLEATPWEELEEGAGLPREEMEAFARMVAEAQRAVFVWSMGITQHPHGEDNVHAIINLALTRGFVGREGCGLMPIRGHSGVQGGAEMGAYATVFPGGLPINEENARRLSELYGFEVPPKRGLTAPEMIEAAHRGELDLLFSVGGNFHEVLPGPDFVREALERVPLRVHMDIVLSPPMFFEPGEAVILLPATTRYEGPGGVTETTTERRVIFSPEIPGPRIGEARPEWWVFGEIAARVRPELADRVRFPNTQTIREEIARVIPFYDGIQHLRKKGDQFQYGGPWLCAGGQFPTPDGKAHFKVVRPPRVEIPEGAFQVATRRGKQFNSMIHEDIDPLNGLPRDAVLMHPADIERLGLRPGDPVRLWNAWGEFRGRVFPGEVKPGTLQVHWPEGNALIPPDIRSPLAGIPAYKAIIAHVEKVGEPLVTPRS